MVCDHRYTSEIPDPVPSTSQHGARFGGSLGFSRNQNNCGSSGALVTFWHGARFGGLRVFPIIKKLWFVRCVSYLHVLWSEREDNHALKAALHAKIVSAFCFAFAFTCVVGKYATITLGGIGSLVALVYICVTKVKQDEDLQFSLKESTT